MILGVDSDWYNNLRFADGVVLLSLSVDSLQGRIGEIHGESPEKDLEVYVPKIEITFSNQLVGRQVGTGNETVDSREMHIPKTNI